MHAIEIVTIIVTVGAFLVALTPSFRLGSGFSGTGSRGGMWFDHFHDRQIAERPSEDELDAPLPRRPLRVRQP